jgi:hypothetical protein
MTTHRWDLYDFLDGTPAGVPSVPSRGSPALTVKSSPSRLPILPGGAALC